MSVIACYNYGAIANRGQWEQGCSLLMAIWLQTWVQLGPHVEKKIYFAINVFEKLNPIIIIYDWPLGNTTQNILLFTFSLFSFSNVFFLIPDQSFMF